MAVINRLAEEVSFEFLKTYSHYTTKSRVLPSLDLKPVQRRLLWSLIQLKARYGKGRFIKSSTVVGYAAKFHPHGDASVYSALCNLINMPNAFVEGRGNFGSIYGDEPAASRYTEVRTSELFEHILDEYAIELGEYIPNYDESDKEPVLLQTKIPIAYLTSVNGIGVGLTTTSPSYHIDYVKACVIAEINKQPPPDPSYAYGGVEFNNRVYPDTKISKKNSKDYLHITSLPIGSSARILNSSPLINELVSKSIIEIIDESSSKHRNVSIYVKAPQDIQDMIVGSMTQPIINNFRYYWKKLRASGYIEAWLEERRKFIEKREYFKIADVFSDNLCKSILTSISTSGKKIDQPLIDSFVQTLYAQHISVVHDKAKPYMPTEKDIRAIIKSKPISTIKPYTFTVPVIDEVKMADVDKIIIDEVNSVDSKLFSKPTVRNSKHPVPVASFSSKIKRYIALRDNSLEVRFNHISRVVNWETDSNPIIIYHDGKTEVMDNYFFGIKEDDKNAVVGFTLPGRPAVIVTESNKIKVLSRLGYINEPIKSAFPATKMLINDKEYVIQRGMEFSDVKSYKILES